jgi:CheY-like chemotaxis protein
MDFVMPQMDGLSATKKIRKLGYRGAIFGLTGNGLPTDIAHFMRCGADGVLLKPFDLERFRSDWSKYVYGSRSAVAEDDGQLSSDAALLQSMSARGPVVERSLTVASAMASGSLSARNRTTKSAFKSLISGTGASAAAGVREQRKVCCILVVDDVRQNRRMLSHLLASEGHACDEAANGVDAIEKVKRSMEGATSLAYDVILMDFIMPQMDGPTAAQEIRALGWKGALFGVTGNGLQSDLDRFKRCGADGVLVKPFDLDKFNEAIDRFFHHSGGHRRNKDDERRQEGSSSSAIEAPIATL